MDSDINSPTLVISMAMHSDINPPILVISLNALWYKCLNKQKPYYMNRHFILISIEVVLSVF